jgi:intein/homing endonuclease
MPIAYIDQFGEIKYNSNYKLLNQGEKQLFAVHLDDGQVLELTSDHEVLTNNGYKQVGDLTDEDMLVSFLPEV